MKIHVTGSGHDLNLTLSTRLIFSRFAIRLALKNSRLGDGMDKIPPEAAERIVAELNHIKNKHGSWDLVEVQSADGEIVKITL